PRGHAGHQLEGGSAARRLRRDEHQAERGARPDESPGGPGPRDVAVRPGSRGGLHVGRQGQVGRAVAAVGRFQQVLGAVDAVDGKGEFINFLDSQIGVVSPNRERTVVDLEQIGPGRYRGRFPAPQEGVYLVGMAQRKQERVVGSQLAGLVVPYAQELRDLGVDETVLRELAELTGGTALQDPQDAFLKQRRRSRIAVDMWPWLVGFVALMMVPD